MERAQYNWGGAAICHFVRESLDVDENGNSYSQMSEEE